MAGRKKRKIMKVDQDFYEALRQIQNELRQAGFEIPATDLTKILGKYLLTHPPVIVVVPKNRKKKGGKGYELEDILPFLG